MWLLENVWIIPAILAVAFWLILFVGKRTPGKGADIGIVAVGASFVLATATLIQWIQRPLETHGGGSEAEEGGEHALRLGGGISRFLGYAAEGAAEAEHGIRHAVVREWTWFSFGDIDINFGFRVDGLTAVILFVVAFISLMVHVFSVEYMRDDRRYTHYYASLALFTCGMYLLVTASNTLQMLFGWEMMGLCSFLLIGHWWEEQPNTDAALKAFFTTRTGDIGLLVGISILFFAAGQTFDTAAINEAAVGGQISHTVLVVAACALFVAVIGKSAQFPLHTWLPDAMAGPTPASALIHAATMVVAGVFLMARLYGVFWEGFSIDAGGINFAAVIGAITLVMAAMLAFVQDDIKKVLAYSTVSQLGYMVMGLGVGAWTGAVFHLFTHAFFKALLFMAAGSVSHSGSHHSFDMKKSMGGLRKYMPWTFATWMVGSLALAGIFPFAGFWSKDEILLGASKNGYNWMLAAGFVGAFMTACYMTRATYLTFFGEYRGGHADAHADAHAPVPALVGAAAGHGADAHDHDPAAGHGGHDAHDAHDAHGGHDAHEPHESNWWILGPLVVLAVMSAVVGLLNAPFHGFDKLPYWFGEWSLTDVQLAAHVPEHPFSTGKAALSVAIAAAGIAVGYFYNWVRKGNLGLLRRGGVFDAGYDVLKNKYYLDHLETDGVVGAIKGPVAEGAYWINQNGIDEIVNVAGRGAVKASRIAYDIVDQKLVDGAVNGVGVSTSASGGLLRRLQTGKVQNYAALFVGAAGIASLAVILFT